MFRKVTLDDGSMWVLAGSLWYEVRSLDPNIFTGLYGVRPGDRTFNYLRTPN